MVEWRLTAAAAGVGALIAGPGIGASPQKKAAPPLASTSSRSVPQISADGVLDRRDLVAIGYWAVNKPSDPFAADPLMKQLGRRFRLEQTLRQDGVTNLEADASWSYSAALNRLSVSLAYSATLHVAVQTRSEGSFVGTNAFGVKVPVKRGFATMITLAPRGQPSPDGLYGPYRLDLTLPPSEARELSGALQLIVEGELIAGDDLTPASCKQRVYEATISDPLELTEVNCSVAVKIDRIAFVDSRRSGTVLAEWPKSP